MSRTIISAIKKSKIIDVYDNTKTRHKNIKVAFEELGAILVINQSRLVVVTVVHTGLWKKHSTKKARRNQRKYSKLRIAEFLDKMQNK